MTKSEIVSFFLDRCERIPYLRFVANTNTNTYRIPSGLADICKLTSSEIFEIESLRAVDGERSFANDIGAHINILDIRQAVRDAGLDCYEDKMTVHVWNTPKNDWSELRWSRAAMRLDGEPVICADAVLMLVA